uniref:Uncharacterized protein n=1 Tax=Chelydra serpentina TaxID=8475 RepID=A0A8C3RZ49_CHESE
ILGVMFQSRLHLHFLKTLEHRTDVSVTSTPYYRFKMTYQTTHHWGGKSC